MSFNVLKSKDITMAFQVHDLQSSYGYHNIHTDIYCTFQFLIEYKHTHTHTYIQTKKDDTTSDFNLRKYLLSLKIFSLKCLK